VIVCGPLAAGVYVTEQLELAAPAGVGEQLAPGAENAPSP
jgi:hypothetical protein